MVRHLAMENNTHFCTLPVPDTRTASEITVSAFPRQVKIKVRKRFGIRGKANNLKATLSPYIFPPTNP